MKKGWNILTKQDDVTFVNETYLDGEAVESYPIYQKLVTGGYPVIIFREIVFFSHNVWKGSLIFGEFSTHYRANTADEVMTWLDNIMKDMISSMYKEEVENNERE